MGAEVTPKQLERILEYDFVANPHFIIFLWGPPGVGKSTIVQTVAGRLGLDVVILSTALEHPHVLGGMPAIVWKERAYEKLPPRRLLNLKNCVLFLDDFAAADPAQQRVALNLTTYRRIGDYPLDPSVRIVFASNRAEDASHIIRPSLAVMNRMKHYVLLTSLTDWIEWVANTGKVDTTLLAYAYTFLSAPGVGEKSFIQTPQQLDVSVVAYPTPRSWFNLLCDLTNLLHRKMIHLPLQSGGAGTASAEDIELVHILSAAWVGEKVAAEFVKSLQVDLTLLDKVVSDVKYIQNIPPHLQPLIVCLSLSRVRDKDDFLLSVLPHISPEIAAILSSMLRNEQIKKSTKAHLVTLALGGNLVDTLAKKQKQQNPRGGEGERNSCS